MKRWYWLAVLLMVLGVTPAQAEMKYSVESPSSSAAVSGIDQFRGWAFDTSGVSITRVEIFINGMSLGAAPCCGQRQDIANAYGQAALNSSWSMLINWGIFPAGMYNLHATFTNSQGQTVSSPEQPVIVVKLGSAEYVDKFDLSGAQVHLEGQDIVLENVATRDKQSGNSEQLTLRVRWVPDLQRLALAQATSTGKTANNAPQFMFDSVADEQGVRTATFDALDFLQKTFGVVPSNFAVVAFGDLNNLVTAYLQWQKLPESERAAITQRWQSGISESGFGAIWIYTGSNFWQNASRVDTSSVLAHESTHILQNELVGAPGLIREPVDQVPFGGPRWAIEGLPTYVQLSLWAKGNNIPLSDVISQDAQLVRNGPPLSSMESWTGMLAPGTQVSYATGFLAIDYLVSGGMTLPGILNFWAEIGRTGNWQQAWTTTIGRTIAQFYQDFESWRKTIN